MERKDVISHIWPHHHNVTFFYRVDVADDHVRMNEEHRAFEWINRTSEDLRPYLKEMIKESGMFR